MPDPTPIDPDRTVAREAGKPRDSSVAEVAGSGERYVLGGLIARGGMGEVYDARDATLNRRVAVKVLQARFAGGSEVARRFLDEARITGQLQHPGVPPVHDLGTLPDGRPFLVMKLIRGRTLADLLRDRPDATHDRPRLVQAFEQICQTVAYAHSKDVLHRDLKPANVMVGAFGEVQVMDWGIAKVLTDPGPDHPHTDGSPNTLPQSVIETDRDRDSATQAGSVIGTRPYMPPEQARGDITRVGPPADVFALGAVLCEILTGTPPYTGTPADVRSQGELGLVDAALARLDECGADEELISLAKRCLARNPADRPADAGVLAGLVAAYRAGVEDRLRKAEAERAAAEARAVEQRKRRRVQLALVAAVGLLLFGGGAFAWWQDKQATERTAEGVRQQEADEKRASAERERLARNEQAIESLLGQCEDALRRDDAPRAVIAFAQAERRHIEDGVGQFTSRYARCETDLAMLKELDRINDLRWAVVEGKLTSRKAVAAERAEAFRRFGVIPGTTPPPDAAGRIHESLITDQLLGALHQWAAWSRTADLSAVLRVADPNRYRTDVQVAIQARDAESLQLLAEKPEALQQPGWFALILSGEEDVQPARRNVILRTAHQRQPGNLNILMALGASRPINRHEGAAERVGWYRAALAVRPASTSILHILGLALDDNKDHDGAVTAYREAIQLNPKFARTHNNLGSALQAKGDSIGAEAAYREAIRLDPTFARFHSNLGNALHAKKNLNGAMAAHGEAVRLDPNDAYVRTNLGVALQAMDDLDGAIAAHRKATRLDPNAAYAHTNLGVALQARGDHNGALDAFEEAVRLAPDYAPAHAGLGDMLYAIGQKDEAVVALSKAARLAPNDGRSHYHLGVALAGIREPVGAAAALRITVQLDPNYAPAHHNLGLVLWTRGNLDGAIASLKEAARLDPTDANVHTNLGHTLHSKDKLDEAIAAHKEAARLNPTDTNARKNLDNVVELKAERDAKIAPPPREVKR